MYIRVGITSGEGKEGIPQSINQLDTRKRELNTTKIFSGDFIISLCLDLKKETCILFWLGLPKSEIQIN